MTTDYAATFHAILSSAVHFRWIPFSRAMDCSGIRVDLNEDFPADLPLPPGSIRSRGAVFVTNPLAEDGEDSDALMDALYTRLELQKGEWSVGPQFWP